MSKKLFILVVAVSLAVPVLADWAPLESAPYEISSSHDEISVSKSGASQMTSDVTLKVLNEQGRNMLVLKSIPFIPDMNKVTVLKASSLTDGVDTPVKLTTIKERAAAGPKEGITHGKEKVIPFTNIKIGSQVKYKYRDQQLRTLVPGHFSMQFVYGASVPEENSYTIIKSELPLYYAVSDPWQSLQVHPKKEGSQYILEIRQTRKLFKLPLELNPLIRKHQITMVEVSTLNSWKTYVTPLAHRYEKELKNVALPPALLKISEKAAKAASVREKVDIVTSELQSSMTYSGDWTTFEKMFIPKPLKEIGASKTGDCKDFSLATVAILRKMNIDAEVAMTFRKMPSSQLGVVVVDPLDLNLPAQRFNHAIVKVRDGSSVLWVDPTNIVSNAGYAFNDIAGSYALEVSSRASELERIPFPSSLQSVLELKKEYRIREDMSAETISNFSLTGGYAKYVAETAISSSVKDASKMLMMFNRTDGASPHYEGVDFQSRISSRITGVEKAIGDVVVREKEGKKYFHAPLSVTLRGLLMLAGSKRVTDVNIEALSTETASLSVPGFDIVDFPVGCTIYTPWFSLQRTFIKTKTGFEVRDFSQFKTVEISAADVNSDKFKMAVHDVFECTNTQQVEIKKIDAADTWESRTKEYTPAKAKKFVDTMGPGMVEAARRGLHIVDNLLAENPKNKEAMLEKVRALRWVGYKSNDVDGSEYHNLSNAVLSMVAAEHPADPEVLRQKTWSAWYAKNNSELAANFQKYHAVAAKNFDFYNLGGNVAERLGKKDAALGAYLKALEFAEGNSHKSSAMVNIAEILIDKGEIDKGIAYYKNGALADPQNTWVQGNLMSILSGMRRWDDAIELGESVMKSGAYGVARKGLAYAYQGKAEEIYFKGLHFDVRTEDGKKYLDEVESVLMKALKHHSDCGSCLVAMGAVYRVRAISYLDRDMAIKSKAYYEKATKMGEVKDSQVKLSLLEIESIISGQRKPAENSPNGMPAFRRSPADLKR
ncbi:DUF3857 domain-containing protein [Bdellovibrio bacteriovorus]|uniref:DUF3857 domain-containing protein n=1 Tax=Bdellovibrio bacteriovorus TaxID=959 RepID=UPI003AA7BF4C